MELRDGFIKLRPLRFADRDELARLANNKKIWNNLRDVFPLPYTTSDAEKFIDLVRQHDPVVNFAIVADNQFIGVIGLYSQPDVYRKSMEIGYWIGEPYWGKGIATRAVNLAANYAFESLKMVRIFASVFEGNEASRRVLEKCGFQLEGVARKAVYKNKKLMDEFRYGRLRGE